MNEACMIAVDASRSGRGEVTCRIMSPVGSDCDVDIVDNADGTFTIFHTPKMPGPHSVEIKYGGRLVPNGQWTQMVSRGVHFVSLHDLCGKRPGNVIPGIWAKDPE